MAFELVVLTVEAAEPGSKWAIGTEVHLVQRLRDRHPDREVHFLSPTVCMCSTMARIDPQHLAWSLENLVAGKVVNQITVPPHEAELARVALDRMLAVS